MSNDNQYYVGEFEIDSRKYAGQITIICKTGEIFLTLTIATDGFGKHYSKLETIKGSVGDGRVQITLINCNHYNGHASFKYNDYEYYLEVKGFDGVTVLDEDNFINLLKNIIL